MQRDSVSALWKKSWGEKGPMPRVGLWWWGWGWGARVSMCGVGVALGACLRWWRVASRGLR